MLKNALTNGYSSQVRGWLVVDGVPHELAQVGPDFCILREPVSGDFLGTSQVQAKLLIEVDGDQREVEVVLSASHLSSPKKLQFRKV
jgi:hypothetical protein